MVEQTGDEKMRLGCKIIVFAFYSIGIIFTAVKVKENVQRYLEFPTLLFDKTAKMEEIVFPKITLCQSCKFVELSDLS